MAKSKTAPKFEPVRNESYYSAMVELRRSSASQKHVTVSRKGSRSARKQSAIRDYS